MPRPFTIVRWVAVLLALVLLAGTRPATAQSPSSPDSLILKGKAFLDAGANRGSVDSLKQARALFKQATGGPNHQALAHYYAALANYRLNNQYPNDAENKREPVLKDAIEHLKTATDLAPTMADAWALLSGCYGQRMGLDPLRSVTLGPKASDAMSTAKDLAPENPRVWIIDGTSDFFTPIMFGGDKERALRKFKKAGRLAEAESVDNPLRPDWGYAEAYAWIGLAHMEAERYTKARRAFDKALSINPKNGWVRYVLHPRLKKQAE
jgi:tetratricopeptide (TPR) repeat protein